VAEGKGVRPWAGALGGAVSRVGDVGLNLGEVVLISQGGERAGQVVDFREGAHARIIGGHRGGCAFGSAFNISLIEDQKAVARQSVQGGDYVGTVMPTAHRVVGIGEIDEFRANLSGFGKKRRGILVIIAVGHFVERPAVTRHMVVECRIGPARGHHRIAIGYKQSHEIAQEPVDPLARNDVAWGQAVSCGKRLAQVMVLWVAVFPDVSRSLGHGRDGLGRGTKDAFIGAEARFEWGLAGAFLRFGAHKGHGRSEGLGKRGIGRASHEAT